ncbi:MAG: hypothetical protein M1814_004102 [Vezdaea aestivalis]|nr:MAG: hypothetical protein M1814_004102 [Vezdaea aestivalis]
MHSSIALLALLPAAALAVNMPRQVPGSQITPAPALPTDNACGVLVNSFISVCQSETSNFDNLPTSVQASCLCYNTVPPPATTWIGPVFDNAVVGCSSIINSVGLPASASLFAPYSNFCSRVGNFQRATITGDASSTPAPRPTSTSTRTSSSAPGRNATATTSRPIQFTGAAATANLAPYLIVAGGAAAALGML